MWAVFGFILSVGLALTAWLRSRAPSRTYYEGEVYGMTPAAHRRYALFFAALGALFAADLALQVRIVMPTGIAGPAEELAGTVLAIGGVLYGATFLRGASGEDE